ncbi:MAG: D-alanyl-D-alanine carboxypeptidase/D-alanyl-D-alanine-endopeptidase [Elusimicrobiales bacterium]|nr:D-alanyl-D-alanine carboxypeptidase/D-alanyl-D-alanine-endopeptidase [Elusimicrobiales bacterium]
MNRLGIVISLVLFSVPNCRAREASLEAKYRALCASPAARNAQWAVYVADADSGKVLFSQNPQSRLIPASTLKLFVTAAALSLLGPDYKFKTEVYAAADVSGGILHGDIAVIGGGDPSLGSTVIAGAPDYNAVVNSWAEAVEKAGIKEITGGVVADVSLFEGLSVPGTWPYEDLGNYYAAQAGALSINDNLYKLFFKPGVHEGEPAAALRTEPEIKGLTWTNFMLTGAPGSGDNGYIYRAPRQYEAELRGTIPPGKPEFFIKGSMPDPALFAVQRFAAALRGRGIRVGKDASVSGAPADKRRLIAQTFSRPLKEIVFATNKRSFNFYAEMLLRALAVHAGKKGSLQNGLAELRNFIAGTTGESVKLADACGLSKNNLASAQSLAKMLVYMRKSPAAREFADSLPVPGDEFSTGHIRNFCKGTAAAGKIRIKSGSLNGVRSYAGYIAAKSGKTLAFAFIINGYAASGEDVDALHEQLTETCALL